MILAKKSIELFVDRVTKEGGPDFISQEKRIATFDNDSTLWVRPQYIYIYIRSCKAEGPNITER